MLEAAASKSEKGELYARLGNVYLDVDKYKEAVEGIDLTSFAPPQSAPAIANSMHF